MSELNHRIDTILQSKESPDGKMQRICQLLYDENEHYNWVGFYMNNEDKPELKLGPYVGAETDHTIIPFGRGICGQVAESNETFVVDDVNAQDNYLACSIETKAELVVPIFKNGKNIGQIDIDSHTKNSFSKDDVKFLEDLMIKVAEIL